MNKITLCLQNFPDTVSAPALTFGPMLTHILAPVPAQTIPVYNFVPVLPQTSAPVRSLCRLLNPNLCQNLMRQIGDGEKLQCAAEPAFRYEIYHEILINH